MTKEELNKIKENIELRKILEIKNGYKNGYSKELQMILALYNEVVRLYEKGKSFIRYLENEIKQNEEDDKKNDCE